MAKEGFVALLVRIPRSLRAGLKVLAARREVTVTKLVRESLSATVAASGEGTEAES